MNSAAILLSIALATALPAAAQGYNTIIRQIQQTTGVVWDAPVAAAGEALSQMQLESGGALFQLHTVKTDGSASYLLDQKLVGAYLPQATVKLTSEDPYTKVTRTRCDRPFNLEITVTGLMSGTNLQDAAKKVLVQQFATKYPAGGMLTVAQATAGTPVATSYLEANGTTRYNFSLTALRGTDATKVTGEEHFLVHALPDTAVTQTQIAGGFIQILPMASGTISGIASGSVIGFKTPVLRVDLKDLYPRSDTWLQIYPGAPKLGTAGTTLAGSMLVLDQEKTDSRTLLVSNWDSAIKNEGLHTIELLTQTPFGLERLGFVSFQVDRTIHMQGTFVNLE